MDVGPEAEVVFLWYGWLNCTRRIEDADPVKRRIRLRGLAWLRSGILGSIVRPIFGAQITVNEPQFGLTCCFDANQCVGVTYGTYPQI